MIFRRSELVPYFLKTALLLAVASVTISFVLVANLLRLSQSWLFALPGIVVFVLMVSVGLWRLYRFQRQACLSNMVPAAWLSQGMFLCLVTVMLILVFDGIWYLIDTSLAVAYAQALAASPTVSPAEIANEQVHPEVFSQFPVMVQALFPVLFGAAAGSLLAALLAQKFSS